MPPPTTTLTPDPTTQAELTWFQLTLAEIDARAAAERERHAATVAARITTAYHGEAIDTACPETAEEIRVQAEVIALMERMDDLHHELAGRSADPALLELARQQDDKTLCAWRYAAVRLVDQRPPDWQADLDAVEQEWRQATREGAGHIRAQVAIGRAQQAHNPTGNPLKTLERWACRLVHHRERAALRTQLAEVTWRLGPVELRCVELRGRLLALEARQADRLAWDVDHTRPLAYAIAAIHVLGERGYHRFTLDQPDSVALDDQHAQIAQVLRGGRQAARLLQWDAPPYPDHDQGRCADDDTQPIPVVPPDQAAAS